MTTKTRLVGLSKPTVPSFGMEQNTNPHSIKAANTRNDLNRHELVTKWIDDARYFDNVDVVAFDPNDEKVVV